MVASNDFNFMDDETMQNTDKQTLAKTATSGNPKKVVHQGLTAEQVREAQIMAGSSNGLDIAAFQQRVGLFQLNIDELLRFRLPKETEED